MKSFSLFYKEVEGNEKEKCYYPTRLDTYGCGCQHDCKYCYAKSLLDFRGLWNNEKPVVGNMKQIRNAIIRAKKSGIKVLRLGGINVLETLKNYRKNIKIINFGYVGSNYFDVGEEVIIGSCKLYHPNVEYQEPTYILDGNVKCYTSNDFVLKTDIDIMEPCVFDMELAYICALGFKNIESIKIVSDNLSLEQYEKEIKK